jgi:hypothetical protein
VWEGDFSSFGFFRIGCFGGKKQMCKMCGWLFFA